MIAATEIQNLDAFIAYLEERKAEFWAGLEEGFTAVGREIRDILRDKWLSGRMADDRGLNIRTGRLHDSIRSRTEIADKEIRSVVFNRGANYWWYNAGNSPNHPNRFPAEDIFLEEGQRRYQDAFESALDRMAA
ncbi:MAG: hypothetical protein V4498_00260 [candidate division FCPU426 bacterium]